MDYKIVLPDRYSLKLKDTATLKDVIAVLNSFEIHIMEYALTDYIKNSPGIELTHIEKKEIKK